MRSGGEQIELLSERPLLSAGVLCLSFPHHVHQFGAARLSSALLQLRRDCGAFLLGHLCIAMNRTRSANPEAGDR
jgi:hypothetical protein